MGEYFTSGLFCFQRKHLTCENFITFFYTGTVVSASPNAKVGGQPLVGSPRLLIQSIRSYPPYPQPEDAHAVVTGTHKHGHNAGYLEKINCLENLSFKTWDIKLDLSLMHIPHSQQRYSVGE